MLMPQTDLNLFCLNLFCLLYGFKSPYHLKLLLNSIEFGLAIREKGTILGCQRMAVQIHCNLKLKLIKSSWRCLDEAILLSMLLLAHMKGQIFCSLHLLNGKGRPESSALNLLADC